MVTLKIVKDIEYYQSLENEAKRLPHSVEYYSEGGSVSWWQGGLAEREGLEWKVVSSVDLKEMLGKLKGKKRVGLDVTYSTPKSVSILYSLLGDERVLTAHNKAVQKTNEYLERYLLETRESDGDGGMVKTRAEGGAIACYVHFVSRANDPQLHTHSVILNQVLRGSDGKLTSLEPRKIFQWQKTLGQIYRNELARQLQELGYSVEMSDEQGGFKVSGIPDAVLEVFSERKAQVEKKMDELREKLPLMKEAELREIANAKSRQKKQFLTKEELISLWEGKLSNLGLSLSDLRELIKRSDNSGSLFVGEDRIRGVVVTASKVLTESESVFTRGRLIDIALKLSLSVAGRNETVATVEEIERAIDELLRQGWLIERGERMTTKEMVAIEREVIELVKKGKGKFSSIESDFSVRRSEVERYERETGRKLTEDQRRAVEFVLSNEDQFLGVQGDAGTGKTAVFQAIRGMIKRAGYEVIGLAPTGKAVEELEKGAGIKSFTVDSFLMKMKMKKEKGGKKKEIWVVDESSMLGSKEVYELISFARERGARVVFVGDVKQLASVEAGRIFYDMQKGGLAYVVMSQKIRQEEKGYRELVNDFGLREWGAVLERIERHVEEIEDVSERLNRIKGEFLRDYKASLIVVAKNSEKRALNFAIRDELKERGALNKRDFVFFARESKNLSGSRKRVAFSYSVGDVVFMDQELVRRLGFVARGNEFTVVKVDYARNEVRLLHKETGVEVDLDVGEVGSRLSVYYSKELGITKGDRVITLKNDKKLGLKNGEIWIVESVSDDGTIKLKNHFGREVTFNVAEYNYIDHAYAVTVYKSQGMTMKHVIYSVSETANFNEVYTALTRGKLTCKIFTDDKETFYERMKEEQLKTSTFDLEEEAEGGTGNTPSLVSARAEGKMKNRTLKKTRQDGPGFH